jgi:hypothetical protein
MITLQESAHYQAKEIDEKKREEEPENYQLDTPDHLIEPGIDIEPIAHCTFYAATQREEMKLKSKSLLRMCKTCAKGKRNATVLLLLNSSPRLPNQKGIRLIGSNQSCNTKKSKILSKPAGDL